MAFFSSQFATMPGLTPVLLGIALLISALGVLSGWSGSSASAMRFDRRDGPGHRACAPRQPDPARGAAACAASSDGACVWGCISWHASDKPPTAGNWKGNQSYDRGVALPKRIPIWISVALLYVAMFSPALFSGPKAARQLRRLRACRLSRRSGNHGDPASPLKPSRTDKRTRRSQACPSCFTERRAVPLGALPELSGRNHVLDRQLHRRRGLFLTLRAPASG